MNVTKMSIVQAKLILVLLMNLKKTTMLVERINLSHIREITMLNQIFQFLKMV